MERRGQRPRVQIEILSSKRGYSLAEMEDPAFHSMSYLGFLKILMGGRYAHLFEPPVATTPNFTMKSLVHLYALPLYRPSLNQRVAIAVALTETVLQLHTAGRLHKGIRPHNVLFFKLGTEDWNDSDVMSAAYLSGYDCARADAPLETTEAPSSQRHT